MQRSGRPPARRARRGAQQAAGFLAGAVAVLGFFAYLASFGPLFNINTNMGPFGGAELTASGMGYWTIAALIAAAAGRGRTGGQGHEVHPVVAVTALLSLLLVIGPVVNRPQQVSVGWALWLVLLLTSVRPVPRWARCWSRTCDRRAGTASALRPDAYGPYAGPRPTYGQPGATGPQAPPQTSGYPGPIRVVAIPTGGYGQPDNSRRSPPTGFPSLGQQQAPTSSGQPPSAQSSGSAPS